MFKKGDSVIIVGPDNSIYNGQCGIITEVDVHDPELSYKVSFAGDEWEWFGPQDVRLFNPGNAWAEESI